MLSKKFEIINLLKEKYQIKELCQIAKVSRSGYYKWKKPKVQSRRERENIEIENCLLEAHEAFKGIYGTTRLWLHVKSTLKMKINIKRIHRLKKKLGIISVIRKKKYLYKPVFGKIAKNNLNREFRARAPLEKLCCDITFIHVNSKNKFMFLCAVKDLYNNEIVSYEVGKRNDCELVSKTFEKLFKLPVKENCIIHTDQGFQFTRKNYSENLKKKSIIQSMSRKGNCWDNAPIESFFSHFKTESIYLFNNLLSEEFLKFEIERYIKFYNEQRIQKNLNGLSPINFRLQSA